MQTYEGTENYIFVSYSHKDSAIVLPIIEGLDKAGYRVWYDAGIEAGSEWPENVAMHISQSAVVLVFLSKNALNSQNCIREIHFSIKKRKEILVVYLEELELSDGMDMQLSPLQAMFYYRFPSLQEFMQKLTIAKILSNCQKTQEVSTEPEKQKNKTKITPTKPVIVEEKLDPLYLQALEIVIDAGCASRALLQRKLGISYPRACEILDWMEKRGYVSEANDTHLRVVYITYSDLLQLQAANAPKQPHLPQTADELPDPLCLPALRVVVVTGSASMSLLQRTFAIGFNRAGKLIDWMEECGFISAFIDGQKRTVLITLDEFTKLEESLNIETEEKEDVSSPNVKATNKENATNYKAFSFSKKQTYVSLFTNERYVCCAVTFKAERTEKNIVIPQKDPLKIPVGRIAERGFNKSTIRTVTIPPSIREIQRYAFSNTKTLQTLTIQEGTEIIGEQAFSYCSSLKKVEFPATLCQIGQRAFRACTALETASFADPLYANSMKALAFECFRECSSLQRVRLPNSLTSIKGYAFSGCFALQEINLPDGLKEIGEFAFDSCRNLKTLSLPKGLLKIGKMAFVDCTALQSVFIPKSLTSLDKTAFSMCDALETVYFEKTDVPDEWKQSILLWAPDAKIICGVSKA